MQPISPMLASKLGDPRGNVASWWIPVEDLSNDAEVRSGGSKQHGHFLSFQLRNVLIHVTN
jgi:hypothetical protein